MSRRARRGIATSNDELLMAAPGWDEVATAIDSWLDGVLEVAMPPAQPVSA